jgi:hypothetical protein
MCAAVEWHRHADFIRFGVILPASGSPELDAAEPAAECR